MNAKIAFLRKKIFSSPNHNWTIEKMAAAIDVSSAHLHKLFKSEMGISPIQFVKELRLEKARELLETVFWRVKQIGFEVGITDQSYFVRAFKAKYGVTPNQYREQFHEKFNVVGAEIHK